MSRRKRNIIIIVAFLLLIALTLCAAQIRLRAQIIEIEREVSEIRGLERLRETTLTFRSRDQIVAESAEETTSPDEDMERLHAFYRALELIPPDLDLAQTFREYFSGNIAGYFEFEAEAITILRKPGTQYATLAIFERLLYAHEFMHVIQDQHYDLTQIWERVGESDNYDLALATEALIEGDADAVEWALADRLLTRMSDRQLSYQIRQAEQMMTVSGRSEPAPAVIEAVFNFPYEQGRAFVESLVEHGGWEHVHLAFTSDPPQSSEQIYHPQRYLAGEAPIVVSLPDLVAIIGEGKHQVFDGVVGEFYLRQHLMTILSPSRATAAASGWGGDRLQIYKDSAADDLMWVWHLVWDGAEDAFEFAWAYRRFLDLRYDRANSDGRCWRRETTHCFARISASETRISMAADQATALALLDWHD